MAKEKGLSGSKSMRGKKTYWRARFTNVQGEREEVRLMDMSDSYVEEQLLAEESHPELKLDLARAFRQFNKQQRLVLFRVLVQNYTMAGATKGMRVSTARWRRWYTKTALPKLQEILGDYVESGKAVL